ncbi:MAG: MFS transporter [Pseudomonadota bacterium]
MQQMKNIVEGTTRLEVLPAYRTWWTLIAISSLYVGFGMGGGIIQGALPPILREQGYSISSVGWLFVLYLPFGITFLWASYIDRFSMPFLGRRTGWIIATQLLAALAIMVIAMGADFPAEVLFGVALASVFCLATMDIALDALSIELIAPDWRPKVAATKLAALGIGGILGGGLFVPLFGWLGWQGAFLTLALALTVIVLPILTLIRDERSAQSDKFGAQNGATKGTKASLLGLLKHRRLRNRLLILTLASCVIFPLAGLNRIMLVDIGVSLDRIGWVVGTLGPLAMMVTAVISMPLIQRLGLIKALYVFAAVSLLSIIALVAGFNYQNQELAIAGATLLTGAVSGMFVSMLARILDWADRGQPATDYAAYYGISRFMSTAATILAAQVVTIVGWSAFYVFGLISMPLIVLLIHSIIVEDNT